MKKLTILFLLVAFTFPYLVADETEAKLHFKKNGFSIAPLEGKSSNMSYQVLAMLLPPSEGFSPNVNIQIQMYGGTIQEYAKLSGSQFKSFKLNIVSEKIGKTSVLWEYAGVLQGSAMHWYAKAVKVEGKVYLVTATATESQWSKVSGKLKACVNSFKCDGQKKGGASSK